MNPQNLTELMAALDALLDERQKQQIRGLQLEELSRHHFSLEALIRKHFIHNRSQCFGLGASLAKLCAEGMRPSHPSLLSPLDKHYQPALKTQPAS